MGLGKFFKKVNKYNFLTNPKAGKNALKALSMARGVGGGGGDYQGDGGAGQAAIDAGYANAIANQTGALGSVPQAFDKARKGLASGKAVNVQQAYDAGKVATSAVDQSMVGRGLYNTTSLDSARMGVGAATSRQVAEINANFDAIEAELGLRQNQAENQIRGNIAQLKVGHGMAKAGQLNTQQQFAQQWALNNNPDAWLDSILGIAGTASGYSIGGPAGGAIGGKVGYQSSQGIF